MEQQGDPLSEDKTEKLGDFMRRVKDDTVLNLYFVTETGSKRIPTPLFGNPTAEQLRDNSTCNPRWSHPASTIAMR